MTSLFKRRLAERCGPHFPCTFSHNNTTQKVYNAVCCITPLMSTVTWKFVPPCIVGKKVLRTILKHNIGATHVARKIDAKQTFECNNCKCTIVINLFSSSSVFSFNSLFCFKALQKTNKQKQNKKHRETVRADALEIRTRLKMSPNVREYGFRNLGNFCLWNPESWA